MFIYDRGSILFLYQMSRKEKTANKVSRKTSNTQLAVYLLSNVEDNKHRGIFIHNFYFVG